MNTGGRDGQDLPPMPYHVSTFARASSRPKTPPSRPPPQRRQPGPTSSATRSAWNCPDAFSVPEQEDECPSTLRSGLKMRCGIVGSLVVTWRPMTQRNRDKRAESARRREARRSGASSTAARRAEHRSSPRGKRSRIGKSFAALVIILLVVIGARAVWRFIQPKHNVVLVILDTVRADALGCYGNPDNPTPHMDEVASQGVRFDQAISTSGWTVPAVASLFTGTWPTIHGAFGKGTDLNLTVIRDEVPTAAEVLKAKGFNCLGFANAAFVSPMLHFDRGFDVFDHTYAYNWNVRRADETIDAAVKLIREHRRESNFVMIHLFDAHLNFDPPGDYATKHTGGRSDPPTPLTMDVCKALQTGDGMLPPAPEDTQYVKGVYLGEVDFIDAQIGRLVNELKSMGIYDRTTLILVADHGEEFWEHNGFEHGHTLYDELIRIPLIVKLPLGTTPARKVVDDQVRILDVMPMVFELVGVDQPPSFIGQSLMPLIMGEPAKPRIAYSESTLYGGEKLSWRAGEYKYIIDIAPNVENRVELYNLQSDPGETLNLAESEAQIADGLRIDMLSFFRGIVKQSGEMSKPESADMSPQNIKQLESLGYIGRD